MHGGLLAHQFFNGVDLVESPRPEVLVVPCVLADGHREPDAVQLYHLLGPGGSEVSLLVEDVVEGQQPLVLFEQQAPAIQQHGGVHGRLATLAVRSQGHAGQHCGWQLAGGRGQLIDRQAAAGEKAGLFKKVCWRIAAEHQLGEDGQPSAQPGRPPADGDNSFKITAEIPNSGIDLG